MQNNQRYVFKDIQLVWKKIAGVNYGASDFVSRLQCFFVVLHWIHMLHSGKYKFKEEILAEYSNK